MKPSILLSSLAGAAALVIPTCAEEGGSAHYMPGSAASFIDAFPGQAGGLAVLNYFTYYDQLTGDSGSGARLGDFESMTYGVGPVLSCVRLMGKGQLLAEVEWLPELDTDRRMEGDYVWFKLGFLF